MEIKRFPLFVDLSDKHVTVIGGGKIATRRIHTLLNYTNNITVISLSLTDELLVLVNEKKIKWMNRVYKKGDLKTSSLCIAATNHRSVNNEIAMEAEEHKIYCSIADSKEESSFWFPGIVQADHLIVGIVSDNGDHRHVKHSVEHIKEVLLNETENRK